MLRVWDTRQASPARTVKRNKLPPREQETHGGGVVKVKERQVEAKWCPCLHAGGGMMEGDDGVFILWGLLGQTSVT